MTLSVLDFIRCFSTGRPALGLHERPGYSEDAKRLLAPSGKLVTCSGLVSALASLALSMARAACQCAYQLFRTII